MKLFVWILSYPVFQDNLKEGFNFRSFSNIVQRGKEQCISVPPSPQTSDSDYTLPFVWREEEGGGWCWITQRIALGDHSACSGGMGFDHKNGHSHWGVGGFSVFRFYFTCSVLGGLSDGGQGGIFFRFLSRLSKLSFVIWTFFFLVFKKLTFIFLFPRI